MTRPSWITALLAVCTSLSAAEKPNVVDIMAALEASVAAAKEARARHPADGSATRASSNQQSA